MYSPSEQCAHNELELELESKLVVSGFEAAACSEWVTFLRPDHLNPSFTSTMNKFSLVTWEGVKEAVISLSSLHVVLTKSIQIFSIFTGQKLHVQLGLQLGLQSILNSLRPQLKAQTITIANKMKKNYVDKSYVNTQFRFGYFHRLALRKLTV